MERDDFGALHYIRSIRNSKKHAYADRYWRFAIGLDAQEPERDGLSYMAAQAVRIRLNEYAGTCIRCGLSAATHAPGVLADHEDRARAEAQAVRS